MCLGRGWSSVVLLPSDTAPHILGYINAERKPSSLKKPGLSQGSPFPERPFRDRKELTAPLIMLHKASAASPIGWADRHCSSVLLVEDPAEGKDSGHSPGAPASGLHCAPTQTRPTVRRQRSPPALSFRRASSFTATVSGCQDLRRMRWGFKDE